MEYIRSMRAIGVLGLFLALAMLAISFRAVDAAVEEEDWMDLRNNPPMRHYQDIHPVKEDAPFVGCAMCKRLLRQLVSQVKAKKRGSVSELDYLDGMGNLCDPLEDEGFWLTHLDIVKEGSELAVKRKSGPGHCEEDCKTAAFACQEVLNRGESEFAEKLYVNKTSIEDICSMKDLGDYACRPKRETKKLPANWVDQGSEFRPKTPKDFAREQKIAEKLLGMDSDGSSSSSPEESPQAKSSLTNEEL